MSNILFRGRDKERNRSVGLALRLRSLVLLIEVAWDSDMRQKNGSGLKTEPGNFDLLVNIKLKNSEKII